MTTDRDFNSIVTVSNVMVEQHDETGAIVAYVPHLFVQRYGGEEFYTRPLEHKDCAYKLQIQAWLDAGGVIT
jgi:hypothetical protein